MLFIKTEMRFACQTGCTKCCDRDGYVYLTENDLVQAAKFLGMTAAAFESAYVIRFKKLLRLRKARPGHLGCVFLEEGGCSIHPVKPTQCRTYPFWPNIVRNRPMWKLEGKFCPGIGKGELIQISRAREIAAELPSVFPGLKIF